MIFLLSLPINLAACSKQEKAADKSEHIYSVQSISEEGNESEPVHNKLTMDILLELYENNALAAKVDAEGLDGFLQYENLELVDDTREESLTGLYSCSLAYVYTDSSSGETEDREYEFQLYYWKPETAEEYGHEKNEIDDILLMEKESGDAVLLYNSDDRYTSTDDLEGFLQKEYGLEQYLTVSLPDGYEFGSYIADMGYFSGWLLKGDAEEPVHGEGTDPSRYASGGIGKVKNASEILQFKSGELTNASLLMNHSCIISETESVESCEVPAALAEYEFDLFTPPEWIEYQGKNPDVSEDESVSHYWYVFMGKEDSNTCYILFLNEQLFSKEDAIEMARSIHFAENAF